jgi:hypothetical protein
MKVAWPDVWCLRWMAASAVPVGAAYVYGGFLPGHEFYLLPIGLGGVAAWFAYGLRRSVAVSPGRRLATALPWPAMWLILLAAFPATRAVRLCSEARSLPLPADGVVLTRTVDPVRFNGVPDLFVVCDTKLSAAEVDRVYREWLPEAGWRFDPFGPVYFGSTPLSLLGGYTYGQGGGAYSRGADRLALMIGRSYDEWHFEGPTRRVVLLRPDDPANGPALFRR